MKRENKNLTRRDLLKSAAVAGAGMGIAGLSEEAVSAAPAGRSVRGMKFEKRDTVRLGIIGVGGRGTGVMREFLAVDNVEVVAVCDVVKEKTERAQKYVEKAGKKTPAAYFKNDRDFENLCKRDDIDFIYIATPWDWHAPMAIAAMNNGKHCGVEVPAVNTLKECWDIVNTSEKTQRHCMIMENCCYGSSEMMVLNMVRQGLLGDLLHAECAYDHDLRELLFSNEGEGLWRRFPHMKRNGNLYPTHGLGPVAFYMDINRTDRFDYMVSMSSPSLGLDEWRAAKIPKDDPKGKEKYVCGDVNTSLIRTTKGRTIMLQHNITSPRPYDRINQIQGTKGIFQDYPARIYVEGQKGGERWATLDGYKDKYEHPLWKQVGELARKNGGHGGMDFIMCYRLIQCIREGLAPDMDVYDAAAWSAPAQLSEMSVARGSMPVKFPNFIRG